MNKMFSSARPSQGSPSYRAIYGIYFIKIILEVLYNIKNILKPKNKKVAVAFPDAPVKPVAFTVPNTPHTTLNPRPKDVKSLFHRLK
jgi:hypothetical protein